MPECPVNNDCSWSQKIHDIKVPDTGDWSMLIIAIAAICIVAILCFTAIVILEDRNKHHMEFKVK